MEKINILWGAVGLALSSFSIVLARYPRLILFRSSCAECHTVLSWYELVPFLSYVVLKGRCKTCQAVIPLWMPLLELMGGLLFSMAPFHTMPFVWALMVFLCIGITACDMDQGLIPRLFLGALAFLTLLCFYQQPLRLGTGILLGMVLMSLQWFYDHYRGILPLGMGDLKLLVLLAPWLKPEELPWFLVMLGLIGALFGFLWCRRYRQPTFPFAPAIVIAFLYFLWG